MEELILADNNYANTNYINQNHIQERDYYLISLENKQYKCNNALLADKLKEIERKIKVMTFPCEEVNFYDKVFI